eukprot:gnl/TRDRNA2_/TRDRNA2_173251_c1_seq3.p1 gnl/TRDRNA2_/TRDRNA2_173251_c1~~gnl/TRDRNA2_/TRDRNA2_173251_c1_seq3.p1  ORF type:complete len:257 (-),score=29.80 gnl/TRDRNA2_/TRDRNA2_173251_c1_seq3:2-772(-)
MRSRATRFLEHIVRDVRHHGKQELAEQLSPCAQEGFWDFSPKDVNYRRCMLVRLNASYRSARKWYEPASCAESCPEHFAPNNGYAENCPEHFSEEFGIQLHLAKLLCMNNFIFNAPFVNVPLYLLNSLYDTWDSYDPDVAGACMTSIECSKKRTWIAREQEIQLQYWISLRQKRLPDVPFGGFLDYCARHCRSWHELHDREGKSNAERVGAWLDAARVLFREQRDGPAASDAARMEAKRIVWQRPGAEFPCVDCCS